jgi:hypothetical protein
MQNVIATLHTEGTGYWSDVKRAVDINNITISGLGSDGSFGELCVYFTADTWDVNADGLIYTDNRFIDELRVLLQNCGFTAEEAACVDYSEQGMQGDDYVSCDIYDSAITAYKRLFPEEYAAAYEDSNG